MDSDKKLPSESSGTDEAREKNYSRGWIPAFTLSTTEDESENAFYKKPPRRLIVSHFQKRVEKMVYTSMCDVTVHETGAEEWLKIPLPVLDAYSSQLLALLGSRSEPLPDPEPSTLEHPEPKSRKPLILSNRQVKKQKIAQKESTLDYSMPPPIDESLEGLQLEGRKNKKRSPHY
jgi:hypothetical protein